MSSVHPSQDTVIEGLHAHAYPVDSQLQKAPDIFLTLFDDVLRVHFDGELVAI